MRHNMTMVFKAGVLAAAMLAATTGLATAQRGGGGGGRGGGWDEGGGGRAEMRGDRGRGDDMRDQRGANQRGFCPPGQRKKAGKGSRFQC
jgi:hypothetical protein